MMRWLLTMGVSVPAVMVVMGIFAPVLSPFDPLSVNLGARLIAPGGSSPEGRVHLLGTDKLGRDVLSRMLHSFRGTVYIGLVGTLAGVAAGWLAVLARSRRNPTTAPDTWGPLFGVPLWALPLFVIFLGLLPALTLVAMSGTSVLLVTIICGSLASVLPMALIYESVRNRASATSPAKVAIRQGGSKFPVAFSLAFLTGLFIECHLSFLGTGVPLPHPSLGTMIASGRETLPALPWIAGFPALVLLVGAAALVAVAVPAGRGWLGAQSASRLAGEAPTPAYAGFWIRLAAVLLDIALTLLAIIPLAIIIPIGASTEDPNATSIVVGVGSLAYFAFCVWVGVKSPGKRALGLRILRTDGSVAGPARRFFRFVAHWCLEPVSIISILMVAWRKDKRGLHDLIMDTVVVRSEASQRLSTHPGEESEPSLEIADFGQADHGDEGRRL